MKLRTVTGPVDVRAITLADAHGHVWIDPPDDVSGESHLELNAKSAICRELKEFNLPGGRLIVDCQPGGCGRDAGILAWLSEQAGIFITATTGYHLPRYYAPSSWLWTASVELATDYFIEELTLGTRETDSEIPATTLKVGFNGQIKGQDRILMLAAAEAARQTGVTMLFHTEQGHNVETLLPYFEQRGVPPNQLYLCHMDKRPDVGLHRELAQAGVLLGYDTFVRPRYDPETNAWPLLCRMVADGLDHCVAIGLDLAASSMWKHFSGGPGMSALMDGILSRLRSEGMNEAIIANLTAQNVVSRLAQNIHTASH